MKDFHHFLFLLALVMAGCGPQGVKEKRFSNPPPDAVTRAIVLIQGYADGQPVGSEAVEFEELVQGVAAIDAEKGKEFKEFLAEVEKTGRVSRKDATRILERLKQ